MEPVYRAAPPFPFLSGDFDAHGHTEGCEVVEAVHRDGGFGFLVWQGAGFQVWTDQGFGAVDGGLGEASAVVVGLEGKLFQWRWNLGTVGVDSTVIWEISFWIVAAVSEN